MISTRPSAGPLRWAFALAALLFAGAGRAEAGPPPKARLKAVWIESQPNATRVILELEGRVRPQSARLRPPSARLAARPRFYIDLRGVEPDPAVAPEVTVGDAFLAAVRITSAPGRGTRVVLDLARGDRVVALRTGPQGVILEVVPEWAASEARGPSPPPGAGELPAPGSLLPEPELKAIQPKAAPGPLAGTSPPAGRLRSAGVPRVRRPPRLEDFLEGRGLGLEMTVRDFRQREPGDGAPASRQTLAYLAYDDANLYCVFVCKEDPAKVRAHMGKRDGIGDSDQVALYLDTFHDRRRAYRFAVNPRGIQQDAVLTDGVGSDVTFDAVWRSDGRVTEDGFVVWMAIPFKSIRFASGADQSWGIALSRYIAHANETAVWPHVTRRRQGFVHQMAAVPAPTPRGSGASVQLVPYGTFTRSRSPGGSGSGLVTASERRAGLDAKLVLRDAFAVDATVNPDFSTVESDAPQVTVNRRYEVFFPEKRPFFLENAGLFRTPVNLFFSRRIVEPEFGARLTAKTGPWSIAALGADDRGRGRRLGREDPLRGERAALGVVRLLREFESRASLGILAAGDRFGPASNGVFSVDTRVPLGPNWSFSGQAIATGTRRADGTRRFGPGYFAELAGSGRHLAYSASYSDRSPRFHSELGYVPRVDVRQASQYFGCFWRPQRGPLTSFSPSLATAVNFDRRGRVQDWYVNPEYQMELAGTTGLRVGRFEAWELYLDSGFRHGQTTLSFYSNRVSWLLVYGSLGRGTAVNYSPPPGLAPFLGDATDASFGLLLRPAPRLAIDLVYYYSALTAPPAPASASRGARVFENHVLRSKLSYQFSRALSLRVILDYFAFDPSPSLFAGDSFQRATGDLLITWTLHPGTALHLGYTDRNDGAAGGALAALRRTFSPSPSTEWQLFLKLSCSLRH